MAATEIWEVHCEGCGKKLLSPVPSFTCCGKLIKANWPCTTYTKENSHVPERSPDR